LTKIISSLLFTVLFFAFNNNCMSQMYWNTGVSVNSTNYFAVDNSATLNITGSFTLECWINPADTIGSQLIIYKSSFISPKYALGLAGGRVRVLTNNLQRLSSKTRIAPNVWNHIAATYDLSSTTFKIFINGILDTSAVSANTPASNTDSLFIGGSPSLSYIGSVDEIRIWNRALADTEVEKYFRTSLGISSGKYSGMVLSLPFQEREGEGFYFNSIDLSGNGNNAFSRNGVLLVDQTRRPLETISINEALEFNGINDYAAAQSGADFLPTNEITLEAWIYPRNTNGGYIIHKGSGDFTSRNYGIRINPSTNQPVANINASVFPFSYNCPVNEWTHIAFTYSNSGRHRSFINGKVTDVFAVSHFLIPVSSDSLYIGGTNITNHFNGFIDEVRIASYGKSEYQLSVNVFSSVNAANDNDTYKDVCFNLDGYGESNSADYGKLFLRNNTGFSHPATIPNQPVSPLNRSDANNFTKGFHLKQALKNIPASGTSGLMTEDSLNIEYNQTISDINLVIALNHTLSNDLEITLIAPNGDMADVCFDIGQLGTNDNITAIFDDNADSSLVSGKYVSISPRIKPQNNMNAVFTGDNSRGVWRLKINDDNAGNTGKLYAWGVQINNINEKPIILTSNCLIQGFYNPSSNLMVRDTAKFNIRHEFSPYPVIDSAKDYLGNIGAAYASFSGNTLLNRIYLEVKHRNSIATWSSSLLRFDYNTMQLDYGFRNSITSAFGSNMTEADSSPLRYAIYGGDVNQDEVVDISDNQLIDNDLINFVSGYVNTDLNGDDNIDITDSAIADNNAYNFVSVIKP